MSLYTINSQATLLAWFNSGMTQDGNLTSDFTVETTTWTLPSGSTGAILTGRQLLGNTYTITLKNSGSNSSSFPGLFKLNGGTIKQLKISGDITSTGITQPLIQCSYLTNYYGVSGTTGTISQVWIDAFYDNNLAFYNNAGIGLGGISCIACRYSAYTITNCQVGRSISEQFSTKAPYSSGVAGWNFNGSVSNCVIFILMDPVGDGEAGIIGYYCGDSVQVSVSNCIVMAAIQVNTQNGGCIAHQNVTRINVNNCYILIYGAGSYGHANMIFGTVTSADSTSVIVQNVYILTTGIYGNDPTSDHVLTINSPYTVTLTNVAYSTLASGAYFYTTGVLGTVNQTNTLNSYTSSTPNTTEPINSFSTTYWDKSYTPPLLKVNQAFPWTATAYTIYNNPNLLNIGSPNPVITWNPSPSTLIYPSPLSTKQLNAQAFQTDGVTPLDGIFTYNPVLGTILNIGASQTLNATFVPTYPSYSTVYPTATVSVVQAPYMYITNQNDLYNFLQNYSANGWYVGYIVNNITLNIDTWTKPTTTLNAGITLDGRGKIILLTGTNENWTGLFNLTGGTVKNFIYDKGIAIINYPGGAGSSPNAYLFGQNASIPVNRSNVNGVALLGFNSTTTKSFNGGFAGLNNNIDFINCQLGTSSVPYNLGTNSCGGFAPDGFQGSFTNCIAYISSNGGQNNNGGFLYKTAGEVTFTKCKVSGSIQGNGGSGGFVAIASYDVYFDNCYSLVSLNNDAGASSYGGFVGNVYNNKNISLNNCYYLGTSAATSGAYVSSDLASGNNFYLNLYNTASPTTQITSSTVITNSTSFINNLVPQYFNNSPSFTGFNDTIYDIASIGSDVYVGGNFTSVNGDSSIQYLAKWNASTSSWQSVGGGVINNTVYCLAVLATTLYVGGSFTAPSSRITTWNGTSFTAISADTFNGAVRTIYIRNVSSIYIGGEFTLINGGTTMRHISIWNGSVWSELGGGLNNDVLVIVGDSSGARPFVGGKFTKLGNDTGTFNYLCYYTGSFFSNVGSSTAANAGVNDVVNTLVRNGNNLYIGGKFTTNNLGSPTTLNRLGVIDVSNTDNPINAIGSGTIGFNGDVNKISINSNILYIVGAFTTAGGFTANNFAVYNSGAVGAKPWSSSSLQLNNNARAILFSGSTIYVGGDFTNLNNVAGTSTISNVNRFIQIPIGYNKTDYSATGQPSLTTPPILAYNTYFTS